MNEHTPWEANKTDIVNSRGEVILRDAFMTAEIRDLILRAVNAHDELVLALTWALNKLESRLDDDFDRHNFGVATAALAKAKENRT